MRDRIWTWSLILLAALAILFGGLWRQETARREAYEKAYLSQLKINELGPGFEEISIRIRCEWMP